MTNAAQARETCSSGKVTYACEKTANVYARMYSKTHMKKRKRVQEPYECNICGFWHLYTVQDGRRPKRKSKEKRRDDDSKQSTQAQPRR